MPSQDDIWYAANATKIIHQPEKQLETFGETRIHYYLVAELMDAVEQVRIRDGLILANRPRVITPRFHANQLLENFGDEARQYADWLMQTGDAVRILEYGLTFRKQEYNEETANGKPEEIAEQIANRVQSQHDEESGVLIGVDDLWEVCLFKFASEIITESAPHNVHDLSEKGLLDPSSGGVPNAVRIEIENDLRAAQQDPARIKPLGNKLRQYGLFEEYEDRFYSLLR